MEVVVWPPRELQRGPGDTVELYFRTFPYGLGIEPNIL